MTGEKKKLLKRKKTKHIRQKLPFLGAEIYDAKVHPGIATLLGSPGMPHMSGEALRSSSWSPRGTSGRMT